jgi:hypothetical protein
VLRYSGPKALALSRCFGGGGDAAASGSRAGAALVAPIVHSRLIVEKALPIVSRVVTPQTLEGDSSSTPIWYNSRGLMGWMYRAYLRAHDRCVGACYSHCWAQ